MNNLIKKIVELSHLSKEGHIPSSLIKVFSEKIFITCRLIVYSKIQSSLRCFITIPFLCYSDIQSKIVDCCTTKIYI